jgi:hypothetical protein
MVYEGSKRNYHTRVENEDQTKIEISEDYEE